MLDLNYWVYVPEVWLILGLFLIISDIFVGFNFFVLPIGIAALIVAFLIFGENRSLFGSVYLFDSWRDVVIWFAALSVAAVGILKLLFQRRDKDQPDINKY